jgi:hypothetical protein
MPAPRERFTSKRSSSAVRRTVKIAISRFYDVCHLYVNVPTQNAAVCYSKGCVLHSSEGAITLAEVSEKICFVSFMNYDLGFSDHESF